MRVIVTGGAGYIGGQTVLRLLDHGHSVFAIDRVDPVGDLVNSGAKWLLSDFADDFALNAVRNFQPDAIIHCAGTSLVGPSMLNPAEYYDNNFVKTKRLCDYLLEHNMTVRFIFSSSAATYGNPIMTPCQEIDPTDPISPYGESKLMIEWMLRAYRHAYGFDSVSFRYFNACGADSAGRHGQRSGASHIIARVLESLRDNTQFTLNGTDFPTADGTCIRDYIHVQDLADAHIRACDTAIPAGVYNLGTNTGHSNREVITMAEAVTRKTLNMVTGPARPGDPAMLTADAEKFAAVAQWQPKFGLEDMVKHAWVWYLR